MAATDHILAIDFGEKRVGVAVAHVVARLPRPLTTIHNGETLLSDIRKLVDQESAGLVVVGLPRGMDGGYTAQTRAAESFARELEKVLTVPVELVDETLTSVDAEHLQREQKTPGVGIDAVAAALILERYLTEHPVKGIGA